MDKPNGKMIVALLAVLVLAVLGVGGYFIVKDLNNKNKAAETSQDAAEKKKGLEPTKDDTETSAKEEEIEAGITYAEIRGQEFYVEVQVNGQVEGTCEFSLIPADGSQGSTRTDDLEIANKVTLCDEDFPLKGLNPGVHTVKAVVQAKDGRSLTLEKTVDIQVQ